MTDIAVTLYGAISTLLEKGWIFALPSDVNSRKKEYVISDMGKTTIDNEVVD